MAMLGMLGSTKGKPAKGAGLSLDLFQESFRANGKTPTFSEVVTHSRSGNATMVDSDGLLKWAPHNLLTYSEAFDEAAWSKTNVTVSSGTSFLGLSVSTITSSATFGLVSQNAGTTGPKYTGSCFLKANSLSTAELRLGASGNYVTCVFDLSAGTAGSATLGGTATDGFASIQDMGGGVYLCAVSGANLGSSGFNFVIWPGSSTSGIGSIDIAGAHLYRSDLGGMVDNPDQPASLASYVPTTSSAVYLPRRGHHVYNGSAWVNEGLLHESEARTNLLLNSGTLATQIVTVTAVPHTLHFTGTGTVTLLGVSTAGPLVGTGTGENNRVSLTFTPTAGTLTLTVSGTVTNAQLEAAPTPSSYIPTAGATVTRAAETLTIPSANLPYSSTAMSIQMDGRHSWSNSGSDNPVPYRWALDTDNQIDAYFSGAQDQILVFRQEEGGTVDIVLGSDPTYTPGILVPFNIASRHGSTFINGAVDGVALTANTTPTALPDLSATDLNLGYDYMGTIKTFRIWDKDLGDTGIEEATS